MSSFECSGQKVEVSLIRTLMKVTVFCFWGTASCDQRNHQVLQWRESIGENQSKYKMSLTSFKSSKLPYLSNIKRCLKLFYISVVFKRQNKLFCRCFQFDFFVFFSPRCKTNEIAALVADKSDV